MTRMMTIMLTGFAIGILSQIANAISTTGGIVHTSYFSTNGGRSSGAAESSVIGPDGLRRGECIYNNDKGETVTVKFEEGRNGAVVKGSVNGKETSNQDINSNLDVCRRTMNALSSNVRSGLAGTQEAVANIGSSIQEQMDVFRRQQDSFFNEQMNFFQQMNDFSKRFYETWGF